MNFFTKSKLPDVFPMVDTATNTKYVCEKVEPLKQEPKYLPKEEYNQLQYTFLVDMIDECFRPLWEICFKAKRKGNEALLRELHNYAVGLAEATKPTQDEQGTRP